ncbi:MAG TPA: PilX N-terminal domain-containing pilus assembly protein [Acidobacteriota bacterium]|nr:PilX N-terminal domain-containing pilus assembly protein [Acidobacteriota bacterium]
MLKNHTFNSEKGAALIFALLGLTLLTLLGLAFSFHANIEYRISENYVTHQEALAIADAGLNTAKATLQKNDFNTFLVTQSDVPAYVSSDQPAGGSDAARNAISSRAARNVNFNAPPSPAKYYKVSGLLTPVTGQPYANGRYFVKVSNNSGGGNGVFGSDPDPNVDTDFRILVRVTGIRQTLGAEKVGSAKTIPNSVAIVEAMMKRSTAFDLKSPLSLSGPSTSATFNGVKFDVDGYNHNGMTRDQIVNAHSENAVGAGTGIATIYDSPATGDGSPIATSLYDQLNLRQSGNVVGAPGINLDDTPSVGDITNVLRTSSDPDTQKVLNNNFVGNFVNLVKPYANNYYSTSQQWSGGSAPDNLGTTDDPKITYINSDLKVTGNASGAGILIVTGDLEVGGAFTWDGVILVVGGGSINFHGVNESFIGGMFVENLTKTGPNYVAGPTNMTLSGNTAFYYSSDMVRMGLRLLPLEMLEWREITPEISK